MRWTGVVLCLLVGVSGSFCFDINLVESDRNYTDYEIYNTMRDTSKTIYDNSIMAEARYDHNKSTRHNQLTTFDPLYEQQIRAVVKQLLFGRGSNKGQYKLFNTTRSVAYDAEMYDEDYTEKPTRSSPKYEKNVTYSQYQRWYTLNEGLGQTEKPPLRDEPGPSEKPILRHGCRHPSVSNGRLHLFKSGYWCECNAGFILAGDRYNHCWHYYRNNRRHYYWINKAPTCEISCIVPHPMSTVENGKLHVYRVRYYELNDESVHYGNDSQPTVGNTLLSINLKVICNEGYKPTSTPYVSCYRQTWTKYPKCLPTCKDPPKDEVFNGKIEYLHGDTERYEQQKLKIQCDNGYIIEGYKYNIECKDGEWDHSLPDCVAACLVPATNDVKNGKIQTVNDNGEVLQQGQLVLKLTSKITCNSGHLLSGPGTITCERNVWSHAAFPKCLVACVVPPSNKVTNGMITSTSESKTKLAPGVHVDDLNLLIICNKEYVLKGHQHTACLHGTWDHPLPECVLACVVPPVSKVKYGKIEYTSYSSTDKPRPDTNIEHVTISVTCDEGFSPKGATTVKCNRGKWENSFPECIRLCVTPTADQFKNAKAMLYNPDKHELGEQKKMEFFTVEVTCNPGYILIGAGTIKCDKNVWDNLLPKCLEACVVPPVDKVRNGKLSYSSHSSSEEIKPGMKLLDLSLSITCNKDFMLKGRNKITCVHGTWDYPEPECISPCVVPPVGKVLNGEIVYTNYSGTDEPWPGSNKEHLTLDVNCNKYSVLKGASTVKCNMGKWDNELPECIRLCKVPANVKNAKMLYTAHPGTEEPTPETEIEYFTLKVTCNSGYKLVGSDTVKCNRSNWDNDVPKCRPSCIIPTPDTVNNGRLTYPAHSDNEPQPGTEMLEFSLTVNCNEGYLLKGPKNMSCVHGVWDSSFPECYLPCIVPPRDKVPNGIITYPHYSDDEPKPETKLYDLTILITCNESYVLSGQDIINCDRNVWDYTLPECVGICIVPRSDSVANGKIVYTSHSGTGTPRPGTHLEHFSFDVICDEDHVPKGASTIQCHRAVWDNKIPECIKLCKVPTTDVVKNGRTLYTSYSGTNEPVPDTEIEHFTFKVTCKSAYLLRGVSTIICNRSIWDHNIPDCVPACVVPSEDAVSNGIITYPTYIGNDPEPGTELMDLRLLVKCNEGYLMVGQQRVTCVHGAWDYSLPKCNAACIVPPVDRVMNGKIEYTAYSTTGEPRPGDIVYHFTFDIICDKDTVHKGASTVKCDKGQWDNPIPECIHLCEVPPASRVKNGKIRYSSYSGAEMPRPGIKLEHFTFRVSCDLGYLLVGADTLTCNRSIWNNDVPECVTACIMLSKDAVSNGIITYPDYSGEDTELPPPGTDLMDLKLTVDCNEGYLIKGQKKLSCVRGVWDSSLPECYLPCIVPPKDKVKNGIITYPSHSGDELQPDTKLYDLTLLITCNEDYIISGHNVIKCIRGTWDKSLPECVGICVVPKAGSVANGKMEYTSYSGTGKPRPGNSLEHFTLKITCDEDHAPTGATTIKCKKGIWDNQIPECIKLCKVPPADAVKNGKILYSSYSGTTEPQPGAEIEHFTFDVTCASGHLLRGVSTVMCNRSIWDHHIPKCIASCVAPPENMVVNGIIMFPSYSGDVPKPGTELMDLSLLVNCNKGYLLYGQKKVTCVDGTWDYPLPECKAACIVPQANTVMNGKLEYKSYSSTEKPQPGDTMEHFTLDVICDEDHVHKGASTIACRKSKWNNNFPECIKLCVVPPANIVRNGNTLYSSYSGTEKPQSGTKKEHFTFKVTCDLGYLLVGVDTVMCNRSKWDNAVPDCIAACIVPSPDTVSNGIITYPAYSDDKPRPGTQFLDLKLTVECNEGYLLNGQKSLSCVRGLWSDSFPECYLPCIVPPKDKVENGIITYPSHSGDEPEPGAELFDVILLVTCNQNYVLSGHSVIKCIRGVWDKSLPECAEACVVPPVDKVANGKIVYTSYSGRDEPHPGTILEHFTLKVVCDKDHVPTSATTIKCQRSVWNTHFPECIKLCKVPPANVVKNGQTQYSSYSGTNKPVPGTDLEHFTLTVTCDAGYLLRGDSTLMCNRSIWDYTMPDCVAACVVPPKDYVKNAIITYPEFGENEPLPGTEVMDLKLLVICNKGYLLEGQKKLTCIHSTWDFIYPECYAACFVPSAKVANGKIVYTSYSSNGEPRPTAHLEHFTFDVICDEDHVPTGATTISCRKGKWKNQIPECIKLCEVPTADKLEHAKARYPSYTGTEKPKPGTRIEYITVKVTCESGYLIIGTPTVSCNRSIWDNPIPKCVAACVVPPDTDMNNGIFAYPDFDDKPKPGSEFLDLTLSITCNKGYLLDGQSKLTCLHSVWDHSLPECYVACVAPPEGTVMNGIIEYTSYSGAGKPRPGAYLEHFTLKVICDETYVPTGPTIVNCRRNNWNGSTPECIWLCEVPKADKIANGKMLYPSYSGTKEPKPGLKLEHFVVKGPISHNHFSENLLQNQFQGHISINNTNKIS